MLIILKLQRKIYVYRMLKIKNKDDHFNEVKVQIWHFIIDFIILQIIIFDRIK